MYDLIKRLLSYGGVIISIILFIISILIYPELPSRIPTHIGVFGPDLWGGKSAVFIWPISLFIVSLAQNQCRLDYGHKIFSFFLNISLVILTFIVIKMYFFILL